MIGAMAARRRSRQERGSGSSAATCSAVAFHGAYDMCVYLQTCRYDFEGHEQLAKLVAADISLVGSRW